MIFGWRFTPRGSLASEFLITGTTLTGIEMVTVSDVLRTMVTFSGVRGRQTYYALVWLYSISSLTSDSV